MNDMEQSDRDRLTRIETKVDTIISFQKEHSRRITALEETKNKGLGMLALLLFLATSIGAFWGKLFQ